MTYQWATGVAALMLLTASAQAQDVNSAPAYGSVTLRAGFPQDPTSVGIQAGGAIYAGNVSDECYGYISYQPSYNLTYTAGSFPLYISAASDGDTTLLINTPDGRWVCNDDGDGLGLNPGVEFETPQSGLYNIWVGTLASGSGYEPAMLHISELGFSTENAYSRAPDAGMRPLAGTMSLRAGFNDDPRRMAVQAGGDLDGSRGTSGMCWGQISQAPDVWLDYAANDDFNLYLSMEAESDTTLIVQGPDGEWFCDDDSAEELNPGVLIRDPAPGRYAIWAATFSQGPLVDATLFVSEMGFRGTIDTPAVLDYSLPSNFGSVDLTSGFTPDPYNIEMIAGGDVDVYEAVGENCYGFATTAPDFNLNYTAGDFNLYISATSERDTTLIINAPDGSWVCNDDSAGSLNPGIRFDAPESGRYDIWVATYGEVEPEAATLHISELGFGDEYQAGAQLDYMLDANYGSVELQGGFSPDPYVVELVAGGEISAETGADSSCRGYVTAAPDFELTFEPGDLSLFISAVSDDDTTLVINTPDGEWICNDDNSGFNPGVEFVDPTAGVYDIWVGTYSMGPGAPARLEISELGFGE